MTRITAAKARQDFAKTLKSARFGNRQVLVRHKKDIAAIVSMEDYELLRAIEDHVDSKAIREALKSPNRTSFEAVKAELGLD